MRLTDKNIEALLAECDATLAKTRVSDDDAEEFRSTARQLLYDFRSAIGEDRDVRHRVRRRLGRVEPLLFVRGERLDPFEMGEGAFERSVKRKLSIFSFGRGTTIGYLYGLGQNVVSVRSAHALESKHILKKPVVQAVLSGLLLGLVCQHLPEDVRAFIVSIVSSVLKTILSILSGIMGPVIFLSLVTSIGSLDDINALNELGSKIFGRFVRIAIAITAFSLVVATIAFPVLGAGESSLDVTGVVDLLLSVFPDNLVTPFVDNNFPQLVILGIGLGTALLTLGSRVGILNLGLVQAKAWIDEFMDIVLKVTPVVPFLSVLKVVALGDLASLLEGARYIIAVYVCLVVLITVKFVKVARRCGIGLTSLWATVKPVAALSFASGTEIVSLKKSDEMAVDEMGVSPGFALFWSPLGQAMLSPSDPIMFTLASFLVASISGVTMTPASLVVLVILTVELSLASPGITAGLTILFASLGISVDYVGLFAAYGLFIRNASATYCMAYRLLEELEAAKVMGAVDEEKLQALKQQGA